MKELTETIERESIYHRYYTMQIDGLKETNSLLKRFIRDQQETIQKQNKQIYMFGFFFIISLFIIIVMAH